MKSVFEEEMIYNSTKSWMGYYTFTKPWRGYIFTANCLSVSLCVCACEQNSSRIDEPIWTQFLLNGCLPPWIESYKNWWPWVKGQGHSDVIPIFLHNSLLTSLLCISSHLCSIKIKFGTSLRYTLGQIVFRFHKNRIVDDVIMTSFKFSTNNYLYLKFYWTYKLRN